MAPKNTTSTMPENDNAFAELLQSKEEQFKKLYPLTHALMEAWEGVERPFLRIFSQVGGFRRGGIAHALGADTHDLAKFSPDQIEQILAEPSLTADLVPAPEAPEDDVSGKKPTDPASA